MNLKKYKMGHDKTLVPMIGFGGGRGQFKDVFSPEGIHIWIAGS
jgi:hypothetical protein